MGRPPKIKKAAVLAKNLSWEEAIQHVLTHADGALHYADIAERIASTGLRRSVGATPAQTVASHLSTSLSNNSKSPYLRVGRGEYMLKAAAERNTQVAAETITSADQVAESGALRAFGIFWRRDAVFWPKTPKLLGHQGTGATDVNFADQIGVYLLHDRERVIYIGRAVDSLLVRFKDHTAGRLSGRWDRFSWFGLRRLGNDGQLFDSEVPWSQSVVVETMEAVLIESLEPPLNRRRGDNFSGAEYIQTIDPQIETQRKKELLAQFSKSLEPTDDD